jgi:predicted transcriptional regulator
MLINKALVVKSIQELPDNLSFDQLVERLLSLFKIEEGLRDLREGKFVTMEEAKLRHEKWLK